MTSEHVEVDPIKTNPNSHKAIGVVAMFTLLAGLAWWLKGSPYSNCTTLCAPCSGENSTCDAPSGMPADDIEKIPER